MPVVDASLLVAYLARGEWADEAGAEIEAAGDQLFAPHLIDAEVGHALRRMAAASELDAADAAAALANLARLPIHRAPHTFLLDSAWALREAVSFYDALYLALAQELELAMVTLDARLARAAAGLPVEVELIDA